MPLQVAGEGEADPRGRAPGVEVEELDQPVRGTRGQPEAVVVQLAVVHGLLVPSVKASKGRRRHSMRWMGGWDARAAAEVKD